MNQKNAIMPVNKIVARSVCCAGGQFKWMSELHKYHGAMFVFAKRKLKPAF